jgi:hypothetical protein
VIRDRRRYAALRDAEQLAELRALSVEAAIALGEDLLRSDLMRFVRPSEARPVCLRVALRPRREPSDR